MQNPAAMLTHATPAPKTLRQTGTAAVIPAKAPAQGRGWFPFSRE